MCQKCDARALFGDGPCDECKIKSASVPRENRKPVFISLHEYMFGPIQRE